MYNFHLIAKDKAEAAERAVTAGVDLEAARPDIYLNLVQLVQDGKIPESLIDKAVRRILTAKFKAGLFEKPYPDVADIKKRVHLPAHVELAQEIAEESVILLQNENDLLPLDRSQLKNIAIIGPNADQVQYGDYSYTRDNKSGITVLEGIRKVVGDEVNVHYAKGCNISGLSKDGFPEAIRMAEKSDAVVVVLGGTSVILSGLGWGKGPGENEVGDPFTCGEGYDLTDINPLGVQRELLQALKKTGKPIVLVLVHGRPWSISWEKENIPAILEAWYPGERGGMAVANILFGQVNPSGRLNATVPQSVGHIPVSYDYKPSAKGINREPGTKEQAGRDYVFSSPAPLFPFGFGLSYTDFEYSDMQVSKKVFGKESVDVSVLVKNTGSRTGKEVVQFYINDKRSSVTTPVMVLKRFKKIELKPGESRRVVFSIPYIELGLWNSRMEFVTEPGEFEFMFAKSAEDIQCRQTVEYVEN
ncbi:MAG: glycoside hydrolase family 3 C-terminal domain-containing protein [Parabacteroides sp.]|nr:glycoside hydrolase family 3 C-terminal domain-containing protein [Parabacteroides sp.]